MAKDLDERVRTLENWRYWLLGAAAAIGVIGAVVGRLWLNSAVDGALKEHEDRAAAVLSRLTEKETELGQVAGPVAWCYWKPGDGMVVKHNIRNVALEVRTFMEEGAQLQRPVGVVMFDNPPQHPYVVIVTAEGSDAQLKVGATSESHFWVEADSDMPAFHAVVFGTPATDALNEDR
jgi:hypothetical protein